MFFFAYKFNFFSSRLMKIKLNLAHILKNWLKKILLPLNCYCLRIQYWIWDLLYFHCCVETNDWIDFIFILEAKVFAKRTAIRPKTHITIDLIQVFVFCQKNRWENNFQTKLLNRIFVWKKKISFNFQKSFDWFPGYPLEYRFPDQKIWLKYYFSS